MASSAAAYIFNSNVPQRVPPGLLPGQKKTCSELLGPGAYSPKPGVGQPFLVPWLKEPTRQQYAFSSRSANRGKMPVHPTAEVAVRGVDETDRGDKLGRIQAPGAHGRTWGKDERKPPHFHVPSRAYPLESGDPRGRDPGLDGFYDDARTTLVYGMEHTSRRYASTFRSDVPARPSADASGGSGELGPGSYTCSYALLDRSLPSGPSPWGFSYSGGKFANVGSGWLDEMPPSGGDPFEHPYAFARREAKETPPPEPRRSSKRPSSADVLYGRLYGRAAGKHANSSGAVGKGTPSPPNAEGTLARAHTAQAALHHGRAWR